jgi:ketosteroid isomerase-like protein
MLLLFCCIVLLSVCIDRPGRRTEAWFCRVPQNNIIFVNTLRLNGFTVPAGGKAMDEIQVIKQVIKDSIGWAVTKNLERLYSIMADDENLHIVNPDDTEVRGISEFRKNADFWMDPRFKATGYDVRALSINLSESGSVAWFSCRLDDLALWDGKPCGWENVRWTGVLEKRKCTWTIVQMHFSYPKVQ